MTRGRRDIFTNINIDYKKARRAVKPTIPDGRSKDDMPDGIWLPISVVAYMTKCSQQTIRLLFLSAQIDGLKFPVGPLLVNLEQVKRLKSD